MLMNDDSVLGRPKRILWIITGSGSHMRCVANVICEIVGVGIRVDLGFTGAGYEVARMYGVHAKLLDCVAGAGEIYLEGWSKSFWPLVGRVAMRYYHLVVLAPATSNTVAKIVHGIADSLASAVANQALKASIPLIILPSDVAEVNVTELPCRVDRGKCTGCGVCVEVCPVSAISLHEGRARINLLACIGCEKCVYSCSFGAISCWDKVSYRASMIDLANLEKLKGFKRVVVVRNCEELRNKLRFDKSENRS